MPRAAQFLHSPTHFTHLPTHPMPRAQAKLKAVEEKIWMLTKQFEEAVAKKEQLSKQVGERGGGGGGGGVGGGGKE